MEKLFIDFVGPLERMKRGNIVILVILDSVSKFLPFRPVRKISLQVVMHCLERAFFPAYGSPGAIVTDNARLLCGKPLNGLYF
jgi:hypothetical protein